MTICSNAGVAAGEVLNDIEDTRWRPGRIADGVCRWGASFQRARVCFVARAVFVLVRPTKDCGKCEGHRTYRKGKRLVRCQRCQDGRVYRLGAVTVHRFWKSVVTDRWLEKRSEAIKAAREGSK